MKKLKMLEILNQIEVCIERNSLDIAKDLIQLEIENLKGITQKNCSNTRYFLSPICYIIISRIYFKITRNKYRRTVTDVRET